jgi:hypothetical protein
MTFGVAAVCEIIALVLFVLAAVGVPSGRFSLLAAGLAFHSGAHLVRL